eukprot:3809587-Rhodomonas_salina.2
MISWSDAVVDKVPTLVAGPIATWPMCSGASIRFGTSTAARSAASPAITDRRRALLFGDSGGGGIFSPQRCTVRLRCGAPPTALENLRPLRAGSAPGHACRGEAEVTTWSCEACDTARDEEAED